MFEPLGLARRRSTAVLDLVGALLCGAYTAMFFFGPVPIWAQVSYLAGAVAGGASAFLQKNWLSLPCFALVVACACYQLGHPA